MATGDNLVLVAGSYADAGAANDDFASLKSGQDAGEYKVVGAVVDERPPLRIKRHRGFPERFSASSDPGRAATAGVRP